jgi:hypothetical protein
MKLHLTLTGSYLRTIQVKVINPHTEEITEQPKQTMKFIYAVQFLSEEDKNEYVKANSSDTYSPLQADGTVTLMVNHKYPGIKGEGSTLVIDAVQTKSGQYIIPSSSEEDLELIYLREKEIANALSPSHKLALSNAFATSQDAAITAQAEELEKRKQARLAQQAEEAKAFTFSSDFSSAKADKKLDVK